MAQGMFLIEPNHMNKLYNLPEAERRKIYDEARKQIIQEKIEHGSFIERIQAITQRNSIEYFNEIKEDIHDRASRIAEG